MLPTDPHGPPSAQPRCTRGGRISPALCLTAVTFFSLACAFSASLTHAQEQPQDQQSQPPQSVADAARQERTRKEQEQKSAKHVYTNEDLKRAHILTPEDQAKVDARRNECAQDPQKKNCLPAPQQNAPGSLDASAPPQNAPAQDADMPELSLGEIARQYRQQKELNALAPRQSEPFHLGLPAAALAAPIVPAHPVIDIPAPPVLRPELHSTFSRRDPFARVPARPRPELGDASRLHPALRPPSKLTAPAAPKLSPAPLPDESAGGFAARKPARPSLRIEPVQPSVPQTHHRATLPAAPSNIVPSVKPSAPLALPSAKPASPLAPHATVRPILPRRRSTVLPSPAAPVGIAPSVKPSAPLAAPSTKPASPFAPNGTVRPVLPRRPATATASPAVPANLAPSAKPTAPLAVPPTKPASPFIPNATVRPILPRRPSTGSSPAPADIAPWVMRKPVAPKNPRVLTIPPISSASPAAPSALAPSTVRVQPGDSLWKLALEHFGRGTAWPRILAVNPGLTDPNHLQIGTMLTLPAANSAANRKASNSETTITVHDGDTLWSLANSYLGRSALWPCLAAANPALASPDLIFAGQQLSIPSACASPASRPRAKE